MLLISTLGLQLKPLQLVVELGWVDVDILHALQDALPRCIIAGDKGHFVQVQMTKMKKP